MSNFLDSTNSLMFFIYKWDSISISDPALIASSVACAPSLAYPWGIISWIDPQSEITKPSKFHSPFKRSLCKNKLPVTGTPSNSLKPFIKVLTPASSVAMKGGKIMLYKVFLLTSTVL